MKTIVSLAIAAALSVAPAYAACTYPKAPAAIPDGGAAKLEEMLAAQKAVKAFDAEITAYQSCLEAEHNAAVAANPELTDEQKNERLKILAQKQNAAVDDAQSWADRLNAQIRVYKEKNAKK